MRIAIIGGGVSGIAAASMLLRFGHQAVLFESSPQLGGVWAVAYPEVRLQNVAEQYRLSDFPWPFPPDLHPSREQIVRYLQAVVAHYGIDLRLNHQVLSLREDADGWKVQYRSPQSTRDEHFDFVIVAAGQYTGEPQQLELADRERFLGKVITDRDVVDLSVFDNKRVAVVGFGKSAVDMAALAVERGAQVHHVFRAARWLLPKRYFGIHYTKLLFARMSTFFIPAWVHPTEAERFVHAHLRPLVSSFWTMIETLTRLQCGLHGLQWNAEVRRRMETLRSSMPLSYEMRSAVGVAPDNYYSLVAEGRIEPCRGEVAGFSERALRLADGREIPCDLVVMSTGWKSPRFPYLPAHYRQMLESESDGMQLYRHLLHPRIPRLAFCGYNHSFLHLPNVEVSMLWLCAHLRGDLELPPVSEMERQIEEIRAWKREHVLFEPSRGCAVSTRFHQYLDVLLMDLGLRPYRKSNPLFEALVSYDAQDYGGLCDEYERSRATSQLPRKPLPLST